MSTLLAQKQKNYFETHGASHLLSSPHRVSLFCSNKCHGDIILKCQDWANNLIGSDTVVISGFHTDVEQEVLRILLRGNHPVVICPARSLTDMRIPSNLKVGIDKGTVCLASSFPPSIQRPTEKTAEQRNQFVLGLADTLLIPYAAPDSKTRDLVSDMMVLASKNIITFDSPHVHDLICLGAKTIAVGGRV